MTGPREVRVEQRVVRVERTVQPAPAQVIRTGIAGPKGDPGDVGGSLPWGQITGKPELASDAELDAVRAQLSYSQSFASSLSVTVPHGLGRYPSVTVLDSAGTEWEPGVQHDSPNQLTLSMSVDFPGRVICN